MPNVRKAIKRAESWILQVVEHKRFFYDDLEAAIYLVSRGTAPSDLATRIERFWSEDAKRQLEQAANNKRISSSDPRHIESAPTWKLPDFWRSAILDVTDDIIDLMMVRTAEWFEIGGFVPWFRRYARTALEDSANFEPSDLTWWLFQVARSWEAMDILRPAVETRLALVAARIDDKTAWNGDFQDDNHSIARLLFAERRMRKCGIRSAKSLPLDQMSALLLARQSQSGYWAATTTDLAPDIAATADAIHALTAYQPTEFNRSVRRAADWLLTQQDDDGAWGKGALRSYDTTHVLDAIALGHGDDRLTITTAAVGQEDAEIVAGGAVAPAQEFRAKEPSKTALAAYRLSLLRGLKQTEVAEELSKQIGRRVYQGQVSRWLDLVRTWLKAGNVFPDLPRAANRAASVEPAVIEMGPRGDHLTKRQRDRQSDED